MTHTGVAYKIEDEFAYTWNSGYTTSVCNWTTSASMPIEFEDITDATVDMIFEKLKPKIEKLIDDYFDHLVLK